MDTRRPARIAALTALVAMLLLALLPTLGRLSVASSAHAHALHGGHEDGAVQDHAGASMDCAYCAIAAGADLAVAAAPRLDAPLHSANVRYRPDAHVPQAAISGLGSRGPPRASRT